MNEGEKPLSCTYGCVHHDVCPCRVDAEKRIQELEDKCETYAVDCAAYLKEAADKVAQLTEEKERLSSRVKELEETLRPFAAEAGEWMPFASDSEKLYGQMNNTGEVTMEPTLLRLGHLRKARQAIKGTPDKEAGQDFRANCEFCKTPHYGHYHCGKCNFIGPTTIDSIRHACGVVQGGGESK